MKYLLDTNICIYIINKKPLKLIEYINKAGFDNIYLSIICHSELYFGACKSQQIEKNIKNVEQFCSFFEVLPFDLSASKQYGKLRAEQEKEGNIIGNMDMLITSQCLANNLTLITNNQKEFQRIPTLKIANWL